MNNTPWRQDEEDGDARTEGIVNGHLTDSVDHFLNSSPTFATALRQTFLQFHVQHTLPPSLPPNESNSSQPPSNQQVAKNVVPPRQSPILPPSLLLLALNSLLEKLADGVDPKLRRLSLRKFTYCDIQALTEDLSKVDNCIHFDPYKPLDFEQYEWSARQAFKNMAVGKSKRLGLYILGGMMTLHFVHRMVRKVPYIGRHAAIIVRILSPTPIMGPLLGIMGASSWEEKITFSL